jgi:hypothetical protein
LPRPLSFQWQERSHRPTRPDRQQVRPQTFRGGEPDFVSRTVGERPLGIASQLLAVSKSGDMALLTEVRTLSNWMQVGTLARAPLAGGAPREIVRDVGDATWTPDGRDLVITHFIADQRRWRLEYPAGPDLRNRSVD